MDGPCAGQTGRLQLLPAHTTAVQTTPVVHRFFEICSLNRRLGSDSRTALPTSSCTSQCRWHPKLRHVRLGSGLTPISGANTSELMIFIKKTASCFHGLRFGPFHVRHAPQPPLDSCVLTLVWHRCCLLKYMRARFSSCRPLLRSISSSKVLCCW